MELLILKSSGAEIKRFGKSPGKVDIPGTGDVVFTKGAARPIDIGPDHFLAVATIVTNDVGDTQKPGPIVSVVGKEVTLTRTAVEKDSSDIKEEIDGKRVIAYGSVGNQLDMIYWDGKNGTTVWADHIATVKAANPKP